MVEKIKDNRGRPKGKLGSSVLNSKKKEIEDMLKRKFAQSQIARVLNVPYSNLVYFVRTRKLR